MSIRVADVETTGTRADHDQIIELCVQFDLPEGEQKIWRIKPGIAIPPAATAIHHISDADVKDCPRFADVAKDIRAAFAEAEVIIGYNIDFDLNMIQAEFRRARMPELDLRNVHVVDALGLWRVCEPRNLSAAHEKFCGTKLEGAHGSGADVAATGRVLWNMIDHFGLGDITWEALALKSSPTRAKWVGPTHHLQRDADGDVVVTFGKNKDRTVIELAQTDPKYLSWIMQQDFPNHVKTIASNAIRLRSDEKAFQAWVDTQFPPRVAPRSL